MGSVSLDPILHTGPVALASAFSWVKVFEHIALVRHPPLLMLPEAGERNLCGS